MKLIPRAEVSMAVKRAILSRIRRKHPTILKISFLVAFIFAITLLINKVIHPGSNGHTNEELSNLLIAEPTELSFWDRGDIRNGENTKKIDWHDYKYLYKEAKRKGLGENGEKAQLGSDDKQNEEKVFAASGYNGLLSDKISPNRSVKDIRHPECRKKEYLENLPTFSVILPFYNEHFSTLMRSVHSVINRSPPHLLRQVVLVDDGSTKESLKEGLDNYLKYNISKTVVVRIPKREGLIRARLAGAKRTSADVLIFLDSHVEASTNWIPPLLEPIAMDYRTCVCPFIDVIDHTNFEYRAQDEGARGAFDWRFYYKRLPLLPEDLKHPSAPFRSPIMAGGLFAISSKFFWELGGYDEGLLIWGGEQYELSFKIWQCGGQMLDAPCSRVGHIYRKFVPFPDPGIGDFLGRNYRRVAEVWMDEYAEYLYSRNPHWKTIDTGDISAQLAIRKKWNCKPFKWFMEEVAFDLPKKYPYVEPENLFSGEIRSIANPNLCINARIPKPHEDLTVTECNNVTGNDDDNVKFKMTYLRDIRLKTKNFCLDVSRSENPSTIQLYECHGGQGNQEWNFDREKHWLVQGHNRRCLDIDLDNLKVFVKYCDTTLKTQQWHVDNINLKMIAQYAKLNS